MKLGLQEHMELVKQDESFCFMPEQDMPAQEGKESYEYLCTTYIHNIYNSVKVSVMGTMKRHRVLAGGHVSLKSLLCGIYAVIFWQNSNKFENKVTDFISYPCRDFHFLSCCHR